MGCKKVPVILASVILLGCGLVFAKNTVLAEGGGGGQGQGTSCDNWKRYCRKANGDGPIKGGSTWRVFKKSSGSLSIPGSKNNDGKVDVTGTTIKGCDNKNIVVYGYNSNYKEGKKRNKDSASSGNSLHTGVLNFCGSKAAYRTKGQCSSTGEIVYRTAWANNIITETKLKNMEKSGQTLASLNSHANDIRSATAISNKYGAVLDLSAAKYLFNKVKTFCNTNPGSPTCSGIKNKNITDLAWFCFDPEVMEVPYTTEPTTRIDDSIVYSGEKAQVVSASIKVKSNNSSAKTKDSSTSQIVTFIIPSSTNLKNAVGGNSSSPSNPQSYYQSKGANTFSTITPSSSVQSLSVGSATIYNGSTKVPDANVGDRFCIATGIKPSSNEDSNWNISNASCRTIAKKPSLQVENSSVHSSGTINTSTSTKQTTRRTYGSWGEYLVIAGGNIKGMSSGGALSGGFSDSNFCKLSPLTITNNECKTNSNSTLLGNSGIASQNFASRIIAYYDNIKDEGGVQTTTAPTNIADASFGSGNIIRITGSGTTTITGNITNSDPSNPKIILADGSINIRDSVTDINAWLISKGTINTCDGIDNPSNVLTSDKCNQSLTINGIASAKKILFYRTAGAERYDYSKSAEIFNFTPSIYGYGYQESLKHTSKPSTVYTHELPPRY